MYSDIIMLTVVALTSLIQAQIGVGLLAFGTPLLLILGFDYIHTLSILLPCSIAISTAQIVEPSSRPEDGPPHWKRTTLVLALSTTGGFSLWFSFIQGTNIKGIVGLALLVSAFVSQIPVIRTFVGRTFSRHRFRALVVIGAIHGICNMGGSFLTLFADVTEPTKLRKRFVVAMGYVTMAAVQLLIVVSNYVLRLNSDDPHIMPWDQMLKGLIVSSFFYHLIGKQLFYSTSERAYTWVMRSCMFGLGLVVMVA